MSKRKLGTADIEAGDGLRKAIERLNETRPDLLNNDIIHMEMVGTGVSRTLIVVYWWDDHK